jgi:hypothetical protein
MVYNKQRAGFNNDSSPLFKRLCFPLRSGPYGAIFTGGIFHVTSIIEGFLFLASRGTLSAFGSIALPLPVVESAGTGGKAAIPPIGADDNISLAPAAALNADRVLGSLYAVYPGPLQCGLNDFPGNKDLCSLRAVQLESPFAKGGLHGRRLFAVKELCGRLAPCRGKGCDKS